MRRRLSGLSRYSSPSQQRDDGRAGHFLSQVIRAASRRSCYRNTHVGSLAPSARVARRHACATTNRDGQQVAGWNDRHPRAVRARRRAPPDPRGRRVSAAVRLDDANGSARRERVRCRLGDPQRRGRVLVATWRVLEGRPCVDSGSLRHRPRAAPALRPAARRRLALRRSDGRPDVHVGADQRSEEPLPSEPQGRPPRGLERDRVDRDSEARRLVARSSARLVPDRVLPFPRAQPRAVRTEIPAPADGPGTDA